MALIILLDNVTSHNKIPSGKSIFVFNPRKCVDSIGGYCEVGSFKSPKLLKREGALPLNENGSLNGILKCVCVCKGFTN